MTNKLVEQLGDDLSQLRRSTAEDITRAGENALAKKQGTDGIVVYAPLGETVIPKTKGETDFYRLIKLAPDQTVTTLPFHTFIPIEYQGKGISWRVPTNTAPINIEGPLGQSAKDGTAITNRPMIILTAGQVIPGDNLYSDLWATIAQWQPNRKRIPITMLDSALAIDLSRHHEVTTIQFGFKGEAVPVFSNQMTASIFTKGLMDWIGKKGLLGEDTVAEHQVAAALNEIRLRNPLWRVYWERTQARQKLGLLVNTLSSPDTLIAALEIFLDTSSPNLAQAKTAIKAIGTSLQQEKNLDWPKMAQIINDELGSEPLPITLNVGLNPLLDFMKASSGVSISDGTAAHQAFEQIFQGDEGQDYNMLIHADAHRLLLLDPGILATMIEGVQLKWIPLLNKITRLYVEAGEARLKVQAIAWEAYRDGAVELAEAILKRKTAIMTAVRKTGRETGDKIADSLANIAAGIIKEQIADRFINAAKQLPGEDNGTDIIIQPTEH